MSDGHLVFTANGANAAGQPTALLVRNQLKCWSSKIQVHLSIPPAPVSPVAPVEPKLNEVKPTLPTPLNPVSPVAPVKPVKEEIEKIKEPTPPTPVTRFLQFLQLNQKPLSNQNTKQSLKLRNLNQLK